MEMLEKVCKDLRVEIGEKWAGSDGNKYKIYENGVLVMYYKKSDGKTTYEIANDLWVSILTGELKPRWEPKDGEIYYTPYFTHDQDKRGFSNVWRNGKWDKWMYDNKLAFKTKEEAIECTNKMLEAIKE